MLGMDFAINTRFGDFGRRLKTLKNLKPNGFIIARSVKCRN